MATSAQKRQRAAERGGIGVIVGSILTAIAAYNEVKQPAVLGAIRPVSIAVQWLVTKAWGEASERYQQWKYISRHRKALDVTNEYLRNPDLPPHHKEQLQDLRHELVVDSIRGIAFNQPPPQTKGNSKPGNRQ